jgi:hypothetical protein
VEINIYPILRPNDGVCNHSICKGGSTGAPLVDSSSLAGRPFDARPALPSSTKGPASFLGVIGQSGARSGLNPSELALWNKGESPEVPSLLLMLIVTGCVTEDVGGVVMNLCGVACAGTGWFAMPFSDSAMLIFERAASRSEMLTWPFVWAPESGSCMAIDDARGVTWRSSFALLKSPLVSSATSSHSSNSPGSSTSASRSATARQFGQRKLGHVGPLRIGRMHL